MIQNFVFILNNGIRTKVGEFLPYVPLLQQINDPEFHPGAYAWESGGRAFTRLIDGCETITARASRWQRHRRAAGPRHVWF